MVRYIDAREREEEILGLVVDSYIDESKPISSAYLCKKYNLNYSSATVRNILLSLEKQGLLSHIHTSSGRVPTKEGFKSYVANIKEEDIAHGALIDLDRQMLPQLSTEEIANYALDALTQYSGYTSLVAVSGENEKFLFKGTRFILEQPEFEDIVRLRHIFHALEVRMEELQELLFRCVDEKVQILIGDDIGFDEISDCALIVSGLRGRQLELVLALLGPMRMNYTKATSCLYSVRNQLQNFVDDAE